MEPDRDPQPGAAGEFSDELAQFIQPEAASRLQRFLNYLIDNLFMQYGLSYLTGMLVGYLILRVMPDLAMQIYLGADKLSAPYLLLAYLIGLVNYLLYYTLCEKAFRGYTLGKLITGTRAIRQDGRELTFRDALLRSLSRLVPFEALSGFGLPWHDSWTRTTVIKTR
ncbi:MAG TPA: RDD family protein [Chitinophagaceae bacterium]|nr:RDD family protein [Chitinophagaceae bacterium]